MGTVITIGLNTFREAIRNKLLYTLLGFHCILNDLRFAFRDSDIGNGNSDPRTGCIFEPNIFDLIGYLCCSGFVRYFQHFGDQVFHATFIQCFVDELNFRRQDAVE